MRPIDADAYKEEVNKHLHALYYAGARTIGLDTLFSWLDKLPTIDAVNVVRGKWGLIRTVKTNSCPEHWLKCSACGKYRIIKMGEAFPDWCENCGAKMT